MWDLPGDGLYKCVTSSLRRGVEYTHKQDKDRVPGVRLYRVNTQCSYLRSDVYINIEETLDLREDK